jgi:hypothetical protein
MNIMPLEVVFIKVTSLKNVKCDGGRTIYVSSCVFEGDN